MADPHRPRRIDRGHGPIGDLVDRVAEPDVDACLGVLVTTVIDLTDVLAEPPVREVLSQWREHGRVSPTTRGQLDAAVSRHELDASVAHRADDTETQRHEFFRARALACLSIAVAADRPAGERLADCAYEAIIAMGGTAGVVGVLVEYAG
ncbi:hypothetical protein GYA93_10030 [Gordonia desulfuricans]|uniref:Uncharacterized protein n=1 Tax=Gordonia desulfuricans TaxID=89051 RepID=A0A7K3LNU1_9ACTN|nr:hypothetical protein [Gordonia desulfuricans]NDK89914.1 hypothetical protein [Gordonia desulfuricans]